MRMCIHIKQIRQPAINEIVYVYVNTNRFPKFICDALTINYFHTQNENCKYALFTCGILTSHHILANVVQHAKYS